MRYLVVAVPLSIALVACTDRGKPKETSTTSATVEAPLPAGLDLQSNARGGYTIGVPKGSTVVKGRDKEINDIEFDVDGSKAGSINVLVTGFPHEGQVAVTVGKVAETATMTGRVLADKGALSGGAFAVTNVAPGDSGAERCITVELVGRKNVAQAQCCGPKADAARMDEICRTLRVTK